LVKAFGRRTVLAGVDVHVASGETLALVGPNGAGKTTLLRMMATLLRPDAGTLTVIGRPLPEGAMEVRGDLFAELYGLPDASARITSALDAVGLLIRADEPTRDASRGMLQRLGLARLTLHDPRLLLLDEPHAGLDAPGAALLDALLRTGKTVVMVTHDIAHAVAIADRIVVLRAGRIVHESATDGLGVDHFAAHYAELVA
jgi:heme exporter protein A